jgi:hypothetical protein
MAGDMRVARSGKLFDGGMQRVHDPKHSRQASKQEAAGTNSWGSGADTGPNHTAVSSVSQPLRPYCHHRWLGPAKDSVEEDAPLTGH